MRDVKSQWQVKAGNRIAMEIVDSGDVKIQIAEACFGDCGFKNEDESIEHTFHIAHATPST